MLGKARTDIVPATCQPLVALLALPTFPPVSFCMNSLCLLLSPYLPELRISSAFSLELQAQW